MLFMKGTPDAPRCGFSSKVVSALRGLGADFGSFDILSDPGVRQGLKEYSQWPTFPQLYVGGELYVRRELEAPAAAAHHAGVQGAKLEAVERRLRSDMAAEGELAQEVGMPQTVSRAGLRRLKALLDEETQQGPAHLFVTGKQAWVGRIWHAMLTTRCGN